MMFNVELGSVFEEPSETLVFDLAGLDFMSSAGIRILVVAHKRVREREGHDASDAAAVQEGV
jgi:anti-anti-sigma factor